MELPHAHLTKTYEELIKLRTKLDEIKTDEEKSITVLTELNGLGAAIAQSLKNTEATSKDISNKVFDREFETDETLCIGKDSIKALLDFKQAANEVFNDVANSNFDEFNEENSYHSLEQEMKNLEQTAAKSRDFVKYLKMTHDVLQSLFKEKESESSSSTLATGSSQEPPGSSTSTVDFSKFENSVTNAPKSSPFPQK